jgi:DNA-binding response OmpR family regulator
LQIDLHRGEVTKDDRPVNLSGREFQLLRYLIHRAGISVSREELLREIWGYSASTYTRTIDVHISSLRDKLEDHPKRPELIITVAGVGYKFMGSKAS